MKYILYDISSNTGRVYIDGWGESVALPENAILFNSREEAQEWADKQCFDCPEEWLRILEFDEWGDL